MADIGIIKALEYCQTTGQCEKCPYNDGQNDIKECTTKLARDALSLINRQNETISKLEKVECYAEKTIAAQAKEIERLQDKCEVFFRPNWIITKNHKICKQKGGGQE
jgi:hypothetical protein